MIESAIHTILATDLGISQFVGTRIFPLELPLDCQLPALSFSKISNPYRQVVGTPRFQVSCWTKTYKQCLELSQAVTTRLEGFSGSVDGIIIERILPLDSQDFYSADTGIFHIPLDFKIIYRK